MSSPAASAVRRMTVDTSSAADSSNLDVDWLLHSKKESTHTTSDKAVPNSRPQTQQVPQAANPEPTPPQSPLDPSAPTSNSVHDKDSVDPKAPVAVNGTTTDAPTTPQKPSQPPATTNTGSTPQNSQQSTRPSLAKSPGNDEQKGSGKGMVNNLKKEGGRRSSWISNISSKFSSSSTPPRNTSVDSTTASATPPLSSPKTEFSNPFNKKENLKDNKKDVKKEETKPVMVPQAPRRPSVLVAAGKETKLDQPGFLSSALRRLSSSNNATLGKTTTTGALCPRKVMNIDQNRERIKIKEFDQNKLKRVAFCVDVEIVGHASQQDEEPEHVLKPPVSAGQREQNAAAEKSKKDTKDAKYKDKGEGAALKNPAKATLEQEEHGQTKADVAAETEAQKASNAPQSATPNETNKDVVQPPTTRKKEKKKRSEAERKERKERKRREAEENGLVPLEINREEDDDSDSSPSSTPPGSSTPNRHRSNTGTGSPTTDPLRIYKRCCQLRETTALNRVKEQISKPSAALAEAPGTVAAVDLTGLQMQLEDVVTLGDWLAVVPVRKLILDGCNLTDEGVRVILSGLASCKSSEQARANRKLPKRLSGNSGQEQMGVIEKLSLKNNSSITNLGWKHIALFMHMSRSLKAIDLSNIPFPKTSNDPSRTTSTTTATITQTNGVPPKTNDIGSLITRAIAERLGNKFEELILSSCRLSTSHIADIVDCAIKCRIRRLGLADNSLDQEAFNHLVRYLKSGACEGLDLGNNNMHKAGHIIANAIEDDNPLFAISLADCNLDADDLVAILPAFTKLENLKFIDLSRNHALFSNQRGAVPVFRKFLPRLTSLKRLHLSDVGMTSDHVISLSEIFPDCPALCHVSILENEHLVKAMNSKDQRSQEEACAFLASLMTAVRVSHTIVAIEIEVPSAESSEVVKALSSQVVAYSLRNMEHSALDEIGIKPNGLPEKDAPEVLLHLVGHMDGYDENHDNDEPAPDEDYMIASTGIVKALGVCLGTKDGSSRAHSRNITPTASGTATPRHGARTGAKKPRDVSLELCEGARKIRMRLRPALIKEDKAGNDVNYHRLLVLDQTLQRMIQRFEDEYPETKVPSQPPLPTESSLGTSVPESTDMTILRSNTLSKTSSPEDNFTTDDPASNSVRLSRTPSNTSLAARAFTDEEGRIHRFGQNLRREILRPTGTEDYAHGTHADDEPEPLHLTALRERLERLKGEEIREKIMREGPDNVLQELGTNAEELLMLQAEDPEGFETFRNSQLAAEINSRRQGNDEDALEIPQKSI